MRQSWFALHAVEGACGNSHIGLEQRLDSQRLLESRNSHDSVDGFEVVLTTAVSRGGGSGGRRRRVGGGGHWHGVSIE